MSASNTMKTHAVLIAALLLISSFLGAQSVQNPSLLEKARQAYLSAQALESELNEKKEAERSREQYLKVIRAYQRVYLITPHTGYADDALLAIAHLYEAIHDYEDATRTLTFLIREYPGTPFKDTAEKDLNRLRGVPLQKTIAVDNIRYWEAQNSVRVVVDLGGEIHFNQGEAKGPDRVFIDIFPARLNTALNGKQWPVKSGLLQQIRVGQYEPSTVRVVLDLGRIDRVTSFTLRDPDRLIIDIHGKPQSQVLTTKNAAPANSSAAEKEATGEKNVSDAKLAGAAPGTNSVYGIGGNTSSAYDAMASSSEVETHSKQPAAVAAGNNSTQRAGNTKTGEKEAASAEKTPMAVKSPAVVAPPVVATASYSSYSKMLAAMFPPPATTAAGSVQRRQSATTESRSSGEKATAENSRGSSAEIARNDPAASLAMGKSNEPEVKTTSKPTSAPTFEEVAPREERHKKIKEADADVISREARPTADGQRSLIRALGLKIGRIVVDAGHGGHDTGTVGPNGLQEKDLVLDVALRLGKLLQKKMGAEVVYTRNDDTFIPLETRTAIANQSQADLFISVHANSSHDPSARGVETYYLNFTSSTDALEVAARENAVSEKSIHELQDLVKKIALKEKIEESREFASDVQNAMYNGLSTKSLKMRNRGVKKAPFIVLIGANMPSILAEISFVSNPGDERKLQTPEYRQKIAESLYRGVARYVSGLSGVKMALNRGGE